MNKTRQLLLNPNISNNYSYNLFCNYKEDLDKTVQSLARYRDRKTYLCIRSLYRDLQNTNAKVIKVRNDSKDSRT